MRSSKMRLPAFGARGSINEAGRSRRVAAAANHVAATVMPTPNPAALAATPGFTGVGIQGTIYMMEYAFMMNHGRNWESSAMPTAAPTPDATTA